jgi:hypothetical protein
MSVYAIIHKTMDKLMSDIVGMDQFSETDLRDLLQRTTYELVDAMNGVSIVKSDRIAKIVACMQPIQFTNNGPHVVNGA